MELQAQMRVGITTDPEERKEYWRKQYPNLYN